MRVYFYRYEVEGRIFTTGLHLPSRYHPYVRLVVVFWRWAFTVEVSR